jgi:hypothetical protein
MSSSEVNNMIAINETLKNFMGDMKDVLKLTFSHNAELLGMLPEEDRKEVLLAVLSNAAQQNASSERVATALIEAIGTVIPEVVGLMTASQERRAALRADSAREEREDRSAEREAKAKRDALAALKASDSRWSD